MNINVYNSCNQCGNDIKTQIESELSHERETAKNYAGHSCHELITAGVIWFQMV